MNYGAQRTFSGECIECAIIIVCFMYLLLLMEWKPRNGREKIYGASVIGRNWDAESRQSVKFEMTKIWLPSVEPGQP